MTRLDIAIALRIGTIAAIEQGVSDMVPQRVERNGRLASLIWINARKMEARDLESQARC